MALPPFPPQDLAKLVLGYLAEEQLMTAYDEFLQASPYLDAHRNEFDRIFMTSLKNILAEYRAVKIYVETCKPFAVRKTLFQCANILEMVKFLVHHIDLNKIPSLETSTGASINNRTATFEFNASGCEVCNTRLGSCHCKSRNKSSQDNKNAQSSCHREANTLDNSVETTALEDLPGNHVTTRKKQVKMLEKESSMSLSSSSGNQNGAMNSKLLPDPISAARFDPSLSSNNSPIVPTVHQENSAFSNGKTMELPKPSQKIAECSNIFNSPVSGHSRNINTEPGGTVCQKVAIAGTFQDFATGVSGDTGNIDVPDSSTSENLRVQELGTKENTVAAIAKKYNSSNTKMKRMIFQVGSDVHPQQNIEETDTTTANNSVLRLGDELKTKSIEQKITILSDVKVDKAFNNNDTMPPILRNATSTPLMHMQTILINGTPAYRHENNEVTRKRIYTKDEIMAMPTIILVPTGRSQVPSVSVQSSNPSSQNTESANPPICKTARSLEPLVIDVSPNNSAPSKDTNTEMASISSPNQEKNANGTGMLVKTVEIKNASEPKNNKYDSLNKTKTPQALPPLKKASSTPRRISHVRVLDFTTPRRILQETINELVSNENSNSPVEVVLSTSPNLHTFVETTNTENVTASDSSVINKKNDTSDHSAGSAKENVKSKVISNKNSNWDADLRALALAGVKSVPSVKPKPKPRNSKKKKIESDAKDGKKSDIKKNTSTTKISKSKRKSKEVLEESIIVVDEDTVKVSVKPNINIIARPDWGTTSSENDNDKHQNKSNSEDQADTPEMDRISLQNVIGAKLNISDLLETPYKQALYDIQMETPRFMGPDLPDEPLSEIKIMNIPTPRFLNTPKPAHGTPYSTRPTDYSSGGSYYKPDDQDYLPAEDLECSLSTSKEKTNNLNVEQLVTSKKDCDDNVSVKSSRPVRKCTKNVSYSKRSNVKKNKKELDVDKSEVASSCSETISLHSSFENKMDKEISQSSKLTKCTAKTENKNKRNTSIKRRTPVKKVTPKSFMKIKPRRPTPIKDAGKKRKHSESQTKKRLYCKEKNSKATPVVTPAPTKSRRKSSTPRKLHCTKTFNSESSGHDSPEIASKSKPAVIHGPSVNVQDSDTEHVPLRWSDDGSQDGKLPEPENPSVTESDEIKKIQEYIATSELTNKVSDEDRSSLHVDLVKRGFDIETAKIIERDLLDTPPYPKDNNINLNTEITRTKNDEAGEGTTESDCSTSAHLHIHIEDEDDEENEDEVELSANECNEESANYVTCHFDDTKAISDTPAIKLKDKFCMEICIDDGIPIRLRATTFSLLFEQDPENVDNLADIHRETELAVNSISSIDKLYTPMKDSMKAQYYDIFDSTLTSLDTPLKANSPNRKELEATVTEIVLEVEKVEMKEEKLEVKKRKRLQSENSSDSTNECKRTKPEAPYLLHSAIQNIDIESVLSKLHGP